MCWRDKPSRAATAWGERLVGMGPINHDPNRPEKARGPRWCLGLEPCPANETADLQGVRCDPRRPRTENEHDRIVWTTPVTT
jgi:hypothetical protein